MEITAEEVLANLNFKRPDLTEFSLEPIRNVIRAYNLEMKGESADPNGLLLNDLAYLQLNDQFFNYLNLKYHKFIKLLIGPNFVYICSVNTEIAKYLVDRFNIASAYLLLGSLKISIEEKEFIDRIFTLLKNIDYLPSDFLYRSIKHGQYYQFALGNNLVNSRRGDRRVEYERLVEVITSQTPKNIIRVLIIKYLPPARDRILERLIYLNDFSSARFYIEISRNLTSPDYKPKISIFCMENATLELRLALSIESYESFSWESRIIFLHNLEIAKTCICLKALPPVLIQLVLEFARPLASVIIPYLAKVYHNKKPVTRQAKRVKRELKGLTN